MESLTAGLNLIRTIFDLIVEIMQSINLGFGLNLFTIWIAFIAFAVIVFVIRHFFGLKGEK